MRAYVIALAFNLSSRRLRQEDRTEFEATEFQSKTLPQIDKNKIW